MQYINKVPDAFLSQNTYDERKSKIDPSKALLDCNPHEVSRPWRLVKKFERELACFDEDRFLSDNYDEETLQIINAMREAEQPFASFLALCSMTALDLNEAEENSFTPTQDEFHVNMAVVFDLAFAIFSEKRFVMYEEYNQQTSPVNIIKLSQTLAAFTDPHLWKTRETRYQAYGVSSLRRFVTFGCFRNYDLGMCAIKDIFLACCSIGSRVFPVVLADLRDLFANSDELDLRWAIDSVLNDAITWSAKMATAQ